MAGTARFWAQRGVTMGSRECQTKAPVRALRQLVFVQTCTHVECRVYQKLGTRRSKPCCTCISVGSWMFKASKARINWSPRRRWLKRLYTSGLGC
eukprot:1161247-Pelagomonas_calceolata.AAC.6